MSKFERSLQLLSFLLGSTALIGVALLPSGVAAQEVWDGSVSTDWYTAGNWTTAVPDNMTDVTIDTISPNPTVINSGAATADDLVVGKTGTGALTISNGASLTDDNGIVGELLLFGTGTVTVTGPGSTWNNTVRMTIGQYGTGTLVVENGGTVNNGPSTTTLGDYSTGKGTVTVTGPGSTMNNDGQFFVGTTGEGTLNILAGGVVNDQLGVVAFNAPSKGDVTVDGAGSQWNIVTDLVVGDAGEATMTISNGGAVSNVDATIGQNIAGTGSVTVTGTGSTWTNTGTLSVGLDATGAGSVKGGTLNVLDGATVTANRLEVASNAGSTGYLQIDGTGSKVTNTGEATIGYGGVGTLTVSNGAEFETGGIAFLGRLSGSSGSAFVDGGSWTISDALYVGYSNGGYGELRVENGGSVTNTTGQIGALAGSTGKVVVDGPGSTWTMTTGLGVGQSGYGELVVSNGGLVANSFTTAIGGTSSGTGHVTVTGAGSKLKTVGGYVGFNGTGTLSVLAGGTVESTASLSIGFGAESGTVLVDGAGSVLHGAGNTFIGSNGTGEMTLSNGGTLAATFVIVDDGTGSGKVIIGSDLNETAVAAGYLKGYNNDNAHYLVLGNAGTLVLNHTSDNYVLDAIIDGTGDIQQQAGTTYLTTDSNSYTGLASVLDGKLVFNADFSGATAYANGDGTIGGTGTIGDLIISSNGIAAPGNSIGTLHVADTVTFNSFSIYEAEVNAAGASDLIDAGGAATIFGGTVKAIAAPGQYAASTQYTILTAAGGVTGTFTDVEVNSSFLAASLSYDADDVFLTLDRINTTMFNDVGGTPNQQATGAGLDSVAVGNAAAEALALQSDAAKRAALDQLSGELHASIKGAQIEDSRFVREAITDRLLETGIPDGAGVWSHGYGSFGTVERDGNAAGLDRQTGGLFVGADAMLADGWRVGLLGGYGIGNYDVSDRGSTASVESYNAAIYTGFTAGGFGFRLGADYAVHSIDTDRTIAFTGFSDEDVAAYTSQTGQVFGEVSYKIEAGSAWFEPFAALAHVSHSTEGFSETGGDSALTAEADTLAATFATLGFRAATEIDLGEATATLSGSLGWRHAFGDVTPTSTMSFAGGELFTIAGVPVATDAAVMDIGLDLALSQTTTLGASYSGVISEGGYDYGAKAHLGWQF